MSEPLKTALTAEQRELCHLRAHVEVIMKSTAENMEKVLVDLLIEVDDPKVRVRLRDLLNGSRSIITRCDEIAAKLNEMAGTDDA